MTWLQASAMRLFGSEGNQSATSRGSILLVTPGAPQCRLSCALGRGLGSICRHLGTLPRPFGAPSPWLLRSLRRGSIIDRWHGSLGLTAPRACTLRHLCGLHRLL